MEYRKNDLIRVMKSDGLTLQWYKMVGSKQYYIFGSYSKIVIATDDFGFLKIRRIARDKFFPTQLSELVIGFGDIDFVFNTEGELVDALTALKQLTVPPSKSVEVSHLNYWI